MDNWSVEHPKPPRIGFYPACGRDVRASAAILAPFVDRILYCDINERLVPLRIPTMPTTDSDKPIADSDSCRSPWRSGGP